MQTFAKHIFPKILRDSSMRLHDPLLENKNFSLQEDKLVGGQDTCQGRTGDISSLLIVIATFGLTFTCRDDKHGHTFACAKAISI